MNSLLIFVLLSVFFFSVVYTAPTARSNRSTPDTCTADTSDAETQLKHGMLVMFDLMVRQSKEKIYNYDILLLEKGRF